MVLSERQVKSKLKEIEKCPSSYTILDTEHILYWDDQERFNFSLETLNIIHEIVLMNDIYKKISPKVSIDVSSLYPVINATLTDAPLTDAQLKKFYEAMQIRQGFKDIMLKIASFDNHGIPYQSHLIALGIPLNTYHKLKEEDKEFLHEEFGKIYCDVRFKDVSIEKFIKDAQKLIAKFKNVSKEEKVAV